MNKLIKRIVIFLVRKRLGLKLYQPFRFGNQKHGFDYYYFTKDGLMKFRDDIDICYLSSISLNWLLADGCKDNIVFVEDE